LISHTDTSLADNLDAFTRFKPSDSSLMGAPLFCSSAMSTHLESCYTELSRVIDRLPSHDALSCSARVLAHPMHILHCAPCDGHTSLVEFDNLLKRGINLICNSDLSGLQMLQASLPVRDGGLEIRSVARWHFPPSWHRPQARAISSRRSSILTNAGVSGKRLRRKHVLSSAWNISFALFAISF